MRGMLARNFLRAVGHLIDSRMSGAQSPRRSQVLRQTISSPTL